jgi:hypothetical protein
MKLIETDETDKDEPKRSKRFYVFANSFVIVVYSVSF